MVSLSVRRRAAEAGHDVHPAFGTDSTVLHPPHGEGTEPSVPPSDPSENVVGSTPDGLSTLVLRQCLLTRDTSKSLTG